MAGVGKRQTIEELAQEIAADPKEREYLAAIPVNSAPSEAMLMHGYRNKPTEDTPENSKTGQLARLILLEAQVEKLTKQVRWLQNLNAIRVALPAKRVARTQTARTPRPAASKRPTTQNGKSSV